MSRSHWESRKRLPVQIVAALSCLGVAVVVAGVLVGTHGQTTPRNHAGLWAA
jgi:hypothetical protein